MPEATAQPEDLPGLIAAVAGRYAGASRHTRFYVPSKLRRDPALGAILALARRLGGLGAVADLGCGRGQLGLALLLGGAAERVHGLDRHGAALREAAAAAAGLPARFEPADLAQGRLPDCDTALLVDVLYQLPEPAQRDLLHRMAAAARQRLLIRAFDPDAGWRSRVGHAMEWLNRALRGDARRAAIRPMPLPALRALLEGQGLRVSVVPCWGGTPLPNVLLLAEKGDR
jgi:SAM-dependent methyltransferase